jgi:ATP-binding cassette subfamily B (MDR/TAP) protein 1
LLRFYEPCKGQVTFGGRDSRSIPLKELRSRCAYVSQDPQLFEGTIRWNLCREWTLFACVATGDVRHSLAYWLLIYVLFSYAVGAVNADQVTQEALEEACDQACILDFIRGLKDGFETEIGMKGAALSGGQRQVRDP